MSNKFKHIAMLSTHGYFDPVPVLGQTDTGGQVVYVLELAKAIARTGVKVDIFTRWFDKSQKQIDPVPGYEGKVNVIRIPAGPWEFIPKEFIYDVLPELSQNMVDFIKENDFDYDLYHGHYVDAGIVAIDVAKAFDKPSYFTAHSLGAWKQDQMGGNPDEMEKKFNFKHRIAEEMRIFKTVNAQSLTSQVQHEKLRELYDFDANNIAIMSPGVDVHKYNMAADEKPSEPSRFDSRYIYCISRLDTNKGHDLLLNAFALLQKEVDDVTLVIGGGSPNPKPREQGVLDTINRIIAENDMADRVIQIGYVDDNDMVANYENAEMFVLPSLFEPFGMTSQEAMACGTPVVASKFGGIRNVINSGENGLLVDPKNPREFADAMKSLLIDEEYNKRLGREANRIIIDEYSWEAMAEKHFEFFDKYSH